MRYLALEGLVVLFGVLFALLVDRVREERVQQDAADAAVQRLVVEVTQNLGELRDLKSVVQLWKCVMKNISIQIHLFIVFWMAVLIH